MTTTNTAPASGPVHAAHRTSGIDDVMIRTSGLSKHYGEVRALDGLDLEVERGTVLGLLGPNGAGKTTCVRILATLLTPDGGTAEVAGIDVAADPDGVRRRIGLSGQYAAVDEYLTGFENLVMVGRLYGFDRRRARARADELLARFSLSDAAHRPSKTYSGGMRRRLDLAGALVAHPDVLVLDEPTTGLDVRSRLEMWNVIRELVQSGTTLLLTTQYLEEADVLADSIVVIDHGQAIARGTADQLKREIGGERVELVVTHASDVPRARAVLEAVCDGDVRADSVGRRVTANAPRGAQTLMEVLRRVDADAILLDDVGLRRPTLDDVFLALTGHDTADADADADADAHAHGDGDGDGDGSRTLRHENEEVSS